MSSRGGKFFRGGKKFLRPVANDDDDDDDDSSSEEEEEEEVAKKPKSTANANLSSDDSDGDDDDDDDGDDDDDEEEEEEAPKKRKAPQAEERPQKKKPKVSSFFDEEAEDDDDDEDGDDEYGTHRDPDDVVRKHYTEEDIRKEQMDEEAREIMRQQDLRRARMGYGLGRDDRSAQEMARDIEDRHRMQSRRVDRRVLDGRASRQNFDEDAPGGPEVYTAVSQQSLVPSVSDPSFWMISCSNGKEQEMVFQIMNKCIAYARQGRPLGICGAIAAQSKGRIYVESFSEPAVVEAIEGVRGLLQYTMKLVPIKDMTTVMTVVPKKKPVKKNEWVRMTRGHYKGDLALVLGVRDSGLKCIVQVVPRLDLTLLDLPPEQARVRRKIKPPQKFFNPQEVDAATGKESIRQPYRPLDGIYCDFFDNNYYLDGYLIKEVTVGSMIKPVTEDDPPSLDELQRFRKKSNKDDQDRDGGNENEGSKIAASLLDELSELQGKTGTAKAPESGGLLIGDTIEVIEGDLVGMRGKLMSMDQNTVKVKPNDKSLDLGGTGEIEFLSSQVRKYIAVGHHVKVMDGRYANETGTVVAVEKLDGETDLTAVVLTDATRKEISVRTSQLRESAEISEGQNSLAGYELYDLVVLSGGGSANEVGLIVRVGLEDFTVVNNHGISRDVRPEELRGKRNTMSNRAVALDVQGNQMRCGDSVNVAEGPHKGKTATIKRMSRAQLFLYSQTRLEHAGIFVVRSRSCVLAGSRNQGRAGAGDGGATPFATPQSQSRAPAGARGKRDDALVGKTVRIQAGQWKGYLGAVSDATATHVQVELHSRLKKVMVIRERVAVVGDKFGATEDVSQNDPNSQNTAAAYAGAATPMHGGATPMHGGATPMHESGGDEVWRPGAMDEEQAGDSAGVWGADSSTDKNTFGSPANDADDGWGSSQGGSTWQPSGEKQESGVDPNQPPPADNQVAVKHEEPSMAADTEGNNNNDVWFMERVCVQLKSDNRNAVIKEINADKTAVVELEDKSTQTVRVDEVARVNPKEKDMVLVIGGADVGVEGELVCIDGTDAILKDSNEDFKIVDFVFLAKIASD